MANPRGGYNAVTVRPPLAVPAAPTVTASQVGGNTVTAGVYGVKLTYYSAALGESLPSTAGTATVGGGNNRLTITAPSLPGNADGWYAYVTQHDGSTYTLQQTAGSPTAFGTNLVLTTDPTSSGANPPTVAVAPAFFVNDCASSIGS